MVRALRWGSISFKSGHGAAFAAFLLLCSYIAHADSRTKTDIVYMMNGDKITCEVKSLQHGQLAVEPDYVLDTMIVDWSKVDHIESSQGFVILMQDGTQYTGTLGLDSKNKASLIIRSEKDETLPNQDVVVIGELGPSFLKRLRGNVDVGFTAQRANSQRDLSVQTGLSYQSDKHIFSLQGNSQFTSQQKTNNTSQHSLSNAFYSRIRETNWYQASLANFLSSSEQKIDLRSTFGYGLARRFISTNHNGLFGLAGLSYTQERDSPQEGSTLHPSSLDTVLGVQYSNFRFDSTTLSTKAWVYPSLTNAGRVRMTFNQDIYWKIIGDFYLRFSFYDNFDNQPAIGAPKNDLGGSTSVGWSFK
ncbi:MAG TPA: DUF481 domain-containing protein [Silvibacterium sp.]|nr:DUF481 domain-containing protein [Silvibacterium sp.]